MPSKGRVRKRKATEPISISETNSTEEVSEQLVSATQGLTQNSDGKFVPQFSKKQKTGKTVSVTKQTENPTEDTTNRMSTEMPSAVHIDAINSIQSAEIATTEPAMVPLRIDDVESKLEEELENKDGSLPKCHREKTTLDIDNNTVMGSTNITNNILLPQNNEELAEKENYIEVQNEDISAPNQSEGLNANLEGYAPMLTACINADTIPGMSLSQSVQCIPPTLASATHLSASDTFVADLMPDNMLSCTDEETQNTNTEDIEKVHLKTECLSEKAMLSDEDDYTTIAQNGIGEQAHEELNDSLNMEELCLDFSEDLQPLTSTAATQHTSSLDSGFKKEIVTLKIQESNDGSADELKLMDSLQYLNDSLSMATVPSISPCKPDIPTQVLSSNSYSTHTTTPLNPAYCDNNIIQSMLTDGTSTLQGLVEELSKLNQYIQNCKRELETARKQRTSWLRRQRIWKPH